MRFGLSDARYIHTSYMCIYTIKQNMCVHAQEMDDNTYND